MRCYSPIRAFRTVSGAIAFHEQPGDRESLELPCGRCIGCRLGRAQSWAIRCSHEAQLYPVNTFVTLTYDDAHLPAHESLHYPDYQSFMRRLRKRYAGVASVDGERPIRFFCAGEYGGQTARPHYHALLFNFVFEDAQKWGKGTSRSASLEELWPLGSAVIAPVTPASVAYVARYALKKAYGASGESEYADRSTGEVGARTPEFVRMSLRPGIGARWYEQFKSDLYPGDVAVFDGRRAPVPTYYRRKLAAEDAEVSEEMEYARYMRSRDVPRSEKTAERRLVAERVKTARHKFFTPERSL